MHAQLRARIRTRASPPPELYCRRDREQLAVGSGSTRRELSGCEQNVEGRREVRAGRSHESHRPRDPPIEPAGSIARKVSSNCFDQFKDVVRARWSIIEEPYSSIARPFLRMLVFWLMVIFACFGLRAPASPLVLIVIALSAISLSSTMFIILDMDMPYEGLFKISSQTMRTALSDMLR